MASQTGYRPRPNGIASCALDRRRQLPESVVGTGWVDAHSPMLANCKPTQLPSLPPVELATARLAAASSRQTKTMVLHVNAGKSQADLLADLLDRREEFRQLLQDAKSAARRRDLWGIIQRFDDDIRNLDADILSRQVG